MNATLRAIPLVLISGIFVCLASGCTPPQPKKENTGIFGKKTQEVGEFDPNAGAQVSDSSIDEGKLAVPLIGAANAYGPLAEQVTKLAIQHALQLFQALEGRFPKDHAEFMQRIIIDNNMQLPVLPGGAKYQYDVENHELVVIPGDGKAVIPDK